MTLDGENRYRTGHPYHVWQSLQSIPDMLTACLENSVAIEIQQIVAACNMRSVNKLILLGRGSSYYVALAVKPFFEKMTRLSISCQITNEFEAYPYEQCDGRTAVFFLSHSGKSEGDLRVIRAVQLTGALTIGVTDIRESEFARKVDLLLIGPGGPKVEIPATRTYATAMFRMFLLGLAMGKDRGFCDESEDYGLACEHIPDQLRSFLPRYEQIVPQIVASLKDCKNMVIVGFGPNYANAEEASMAFIQSCGIPTQGYELENYIHGPIQALTRNMGVIGIAPAGPLQDRMFNLMEAARVIGAKTVLLAPDGQKAPHVDHLIGLPALIPDLISPVAYMLPLWQTGYHLGLLGGGAHPDRLSMDKPEFREAFSYLMREDKWVTQK